MEVNEVAILDEMYDFEEEFDDIEKEDGQYLIGMYVCMKDVQLMYTGEKLVNEWNRLYLGMAISPKLFFKYEYKHVQKYLYSTIKYCPYAKNYCLKTNIMQLNITEDGLSLVIVKTYWLKIIQRHWKKIMKRKKEIIENMKMYEYIRKREIGKNDKTVIPLPSLRGMLRHYQKLGCI